MKQLNTIQPANMKLISVYEILVWIIYAVIYKYAVIIESPHLPRQHLNFPFLVMTGYAFCITIYVIPYYRVIGPAILQKKSYVVLFLSTVLYFFLVPKYVNWLVSYLFLQAGSGPDTTSYFQHQYDLFHHLAMSRKIMAQFLLTDMLAFISVMFLRFAMKNEYHRHKLENDNLTLQLGALKAQLHPHFLFNTLNSIYGMSLTGAKETPAFILRLSDMMRYILYDCSQHHVPIEKDIAFIRDYLEMEKKRYPEANIDFRIHQEEIPHLNIVPLLTIPFLENAFKHGAHRVQQNAYIRGELHFVSNKLCFTLNNTALTVTPMQKSQYGGVGIENVRKRLDLYYPGQYQLMIREDDQQYTVALEINL
ncbi:sensor histidine kinase [Chitinophaga sp. Cy-1792]|uniref:sensor histidine kinase n=1 Tax=Chitinophaga sp. Cy-1792 TaxID=2608339 RepID=UPI0014210464|nr:histidine kinase [Chitinophaga sp. Cy-1792]NIG54768.1 hypothetical protein [Chitinophaga sp. Cy-1792]